MRERRGLPRFCYMVSFGRVSVRRADWSVRIVALVLAVGGLGLLQGCADEEPTTGPKLEALQADPMASIDVPYLRRGWVLERAEHTSMGKPVSARLSVDVVIVEGGRADALRRIRALAEASGWRLESTRDHSFSGSKQLKIEGSAYPGGAARLFVYFESDMSGVIILTQG